MPLQCPLCKNRNLVHLCLRQNLFLCNECLNYGCRSSLVNIHESMHGIIVSTQIHTHSRLSVKSGVFPHIIYFSNNRTEKLHMNRFP